MRMKEGMLRPTAALLLALLLALPLTGCRVRTLDVGESDAAGQYDTDASGGALTADDNVRAAAGGGQSDSRLEAEPDPEADTRENPNAERREYDELADAEIVAGLDRFVHGQGDGDGAPLTGADEGAALSRLDDTADKKATLTLTVDESERLGVDSAADVADSAQQYYTALLRDRLDTLFECKRLNLYWETVDDHVTVYKTSPEHALILAAGVYDVSARLLEENLRVDDGWICRKAPDVIVKIVNGDTLGRGAMSDTDGAADYAALIAREGFDSIPAVKNGRVLLLSSELLEAPYFNLAAELVIAQTAYPELFDDLDIYAALQSLALDATGSIPAGEYWYRGW